MHNAKTTRHLVRRTTNARASFTATLVGIALEDGFISSLDDRLTDHLPELGERDRGFGDITLRHVIHRERGAVMEGAGRKGRSTAILTAQSSWTDSAIAATERKKAVDRL